MMRMMSRMAQRPGPAVSTLWVADCYRVKSPVPIKYNLVCRQGDFRRSIGRFLTSVYRSRVDRGRVIDVVMLNTDDQCLYR